MHTRTTNSKQPAPRIRDKRAAILKAALKVFAEGGVNGVPMPVLAEQAGVGTGTIYRYFASKEILVNELFREQKAAVEQRLYGDLDLQAQPRQLFDQIWERMLGYSREAPDAYRFLELQDHRPYLDQQSRETELRLLRRIASQYRALQQRGIFRNDLRAEVLMTLVWGAFVHLVKAERDGHMQLSNADVEAARNACWALCTG